MEQRMDDCGQGWEDSAMQYAGKVIALAENEEQRAFAVRVADMVADDLAEARREFWMGVEAGDESDPTTER